MGPMRSLVRAVGAADWISARGGRSSGSNRRPLDGVCTAFVADLPVDGMAISVMTEIDVRETAGVSDSVVEQVEDEQFRLGVGPCYDAFASHRPVLVADVRDVGDDRWPPFSAVIAGGPLRALYAFPLQLGADVVGVVDVYRFRPGVPSVEDIAHLLGATDLVALALLDPDAPVLSAQHLELGEHADGDIGVGDYRTILGDGSLWGRAEIHQATGILVGLGTGTASQALARMRAYAYAHDRTLLDTASEIVSGVLRLQD